MTLPPRPANRLFAAADLPADVRALLAASAAEAAARSGGRPVAPESLHVTLGSGRPWTPPSSGARDGSAPWPHVTLVRLRRPVRVDLPPSTDREHMFDISRAALYDSHQSPGGPSRYRELFAVELQPAP